MAPAAVESWLLLLLLVQSSCRRCKLQVAFLEMFAAKEGRILRAIPVRFKTQGHSSSSSSLSCRVAVAQPHICKLVMQHHWYSRNILLLVVENAGAPTCHESSALQICCCQQQYRPYSVGSSRWQSMLLHDGPHHRTPVVGRPHQLTTK